MIEFCHCLKDPNGLHARPAGQLATTAKRFVSDVRVTANGRAVDGKRLLALMSLGAVCGTELCFCISGEDEQEAESAIRALLGREVGTNG